MKPMLKICGLMRAEDVRMCCELGVDICGFVTEYPAEVPWNLTRAQCRDLLGGVSAPAKSCIVTGGTVDKITALALDLRPDFLQLHYRETVHDTADVVRALSPYGIGVIKTLPLSAAERVAQFGTDDTAECAAQLEKAGVSVILVDSRSPDDPSCGGSADIALFRCVHSAVSCPVMLGGGITPHNFRDILRASEPDIIDIMSGVENFPGVKSRSLLELLIHRKNESTNSSDKFVHGC